MNDLTFLVTAELSVVKYGDVGIGSKADCHCDLSFQFEISVINYTLT